MSVTVVRGGRGSSHLFTGSKLLATSLSIARSSQISQHDTLAYCDTCYIAIGLFVPHVDFRMTLSIVY